MIAVATALFEANLVRMSVPKGKKRAPTITLARPKTETAEVAHPRLSGKTEFVDRVVDTLTTMFNRRQISQLQYGAGERYRTAHALTGASPGGSMDFDRVRGAGGGGASLAMTIMTAAEDVRTAKWKLYPKDFAIVHRVCVEGLTIEKAARQLYDEQWDGPWPAYLTEAGRKFRVGLDELADHYFPGARAKVNPRTGEETRNIRTFRPERPEVTDATEVPKASQVVHATRDKVFRSGKPDRKKAKA